jgi:hypothetical protein
VVIRPRACAWDFGITFAQLPEGKPVEAKLSVDNKPFGTTESTYAAQPGSERMTAYVLVIVLAASGHHQPLAIPTRARVLLRLNDFGATKRFTLNASNSYRASEVASRAACPADASMFSLWTAPARIRQLASIARGHSARPTEAT